MLGTSPVGCCWVALGMKTEPTHRPVDGHHKTAYPRESLVTFGGVRRLVTHTPQIHGLAVLIISAIAMTSMLVAAFILGKDPGKEDLHMQSVMLDTIADATAAAGVALAGAIIYRTGRFYWLDSAVAVLVALAIGSGAVKLLRDVIVKLRSNTNTER